MPHPTSLLLTATLLAAAASAELIPPLPPVPPPPPQDAQQPRPEQFRLTNSLLQSVRRVEALAASCKCGRERGGRRGCGPATKRITKNWHAGTVTFGAVRVECFWRVLVVALFAAFWGLPQTARKRPQTRPTPSHPQTLPQTYAEAQAANLPPVPITPTPGGEANAVTVRVW